MEFYIIILTVFAIVKMCSSDAPFRMYFPLSVSFWHKTKEKQQRASSVHTKLLCGNSGRISNRSSRFHLQTKAFTPAGYRRANFTVNAQLELFFSSQIFLTEQAFLGWNDSKQSLQWIPLKMKIVFYTREQWPSKTLFISIHTVCKGRKQIKKSFLIAGFRK